MALMLFGIVTFLIGFVLMPLVIMLVLLFYFAAIVSKLSEIGRSILWPASDCNNKVAPGNKNIYPILILDSICVDSLNGLRTNL